MGATRHKAKAGVEGVPGGARSLREKSQETDPFSPGGGGGGVLPDALEMRPDAAIPNRAKRKK